MVREITAQVPDTAETLEKNQRYFNGSLYDIQVELLQNSRRAGSPEVHVTISDEGILTISDRGHGVADPQLLLDLNRSEWPAAIQSEDPAGAGFFSLCSRDWVDVRSHDWKTRLSPRVFQGKEMADVEACENQVGLTVSFPISSSEQQHLSEQLRTLAQYYPATVYLNGVQLPSKDFLERSVRTKLWNGVNIGLIPRSYWSAVKNINFYGLTITDKALPHLEDPKLGGYHIAIDVQNCPDFNLVLPARKEVYQNEFWSKLLVEAEILMYEYFASLDEHRLSYAHWLRAKKCGIDLKEASPYAILANSHDIYWLPPGAVRKDFDSRMIEAASLAIKDLTCVAITADYQEYSWAKSLPRLENIEVEIIKDGHSHPYYETLTLPSQFVDEIREIVTIDGVSTSSPIPMFVVHREADDPFDFYGEANSSVIAFCSTPEPDVDDLVDLAVRACFEGNEDFEYESVYEQERYFREECLTMFSEAFLPRDRAIEAQLRSILSNAGWQIPIGMVATVTKSEEGLIKVAVNEVA